MEMSHSLILNEEALSKIPEAKKSLFVYEWLQFLENVLIAAQKNDIKDCQKKIVEQLMAQIHASPGPPIRQLIGQCLATLFSVGDAFLLFDTINKLNDILKNRDDSAGFLMTRLASITTLGCLYERLGRMAGRSYDESVQVLLRGLKNSESQTRAESLVTLEKLCCGMGSAASNQHRDIFKTCKLCLSDRNMNVRAAAAKCMWEVMKHSSSILQLTEFESIAALSFRALEGSNHEVRCAVALLLGNAAAAALTPPKPGPARTNLSAASANQAAASAAAKVASVEEVLGVISTGFLRGGGGFLKGTGEMIKGPAATSREVRVGVTMSYVVMVQQLGSAWLERHLNIILQHLLDLAAQPRAAPTHVDAVYSRQCITFVFRSLLGKMLGEKQQTAACKEFARIINHQMNSIDPNPENAKDSSTQETIFSQHLLVCALQELGSLVHSQASSASTLLADQGAGVIDCAIAVLLHPSQAARLAAAWSLQSMAVAVPSHLTLLIDKCVDALENLRSTPEAVSGYSGALAALIAGVSSTTLGIPHNRGKIVFNTAEELLRSASQNNRLAVQRTQAGWLLIGAVMTLGVSVVSSLVPRMLLLWRNSFPRSAKELESEKARGDAFTWQVALEGRAGALSSICSFLRHCPQLATSEDITKRLMGPLDAAITMLTSIASVVKTYGQPLKAACAMVRLRLYDALSLVPPQYYEASYTQLLRLLVAEFTLAENPANTTTSLLQQQCQPDGSAVLLHPDLQDSDYNLLQQQLLPNSAAGSGALEHDPCSLYVLVTDRSHVVGSVPGPLPLGVAVIDASITLFGHVFPRVLHKHRLQLLVHFEDSIKQAKTRQAVQTNIFASLLAALRNVAEAKTGLGPNGEELRKGLSNLIQAGLINPTCPALRCAAAEALGRLAQTGLDPRFTSEAIQTSFEKLKNSRDAASRTGHSLALGCLHRYGGGLGLASSQQLSSSISILTALSQDTSSAMVQQWALHALASIGEASGPVFRPFADSCSNMALQLLMTVPSTNVEVLRAVGRCCAALVSAFGPELQGNNGNIIAARSSLLSACALLQQHSSPVVQSEAIFCLQQMHMFAPRHVNLSKLVPLLCRSISSQHLGLRRAAVSCLRQLVQREAREVCEHAAAYVTESSRVVPLFNGSKQGLPMALLFLLDSEVDVMLQRHLRDTLNGLLTTLAEQQLSSWLTLFKEVLTTSPDTAAAPVPSGQHGPSGLGLKSGSSAADTDGDGAADDDEEEFHANGDSLSPTPSSRPAGLPPPRWPTRVFAAQSTGKLLLLMRESTSTAHFDLSAARQLSSANGADYLVLHLSDLIRLAFIAATSDCDALRMEGLHLLQLLIECFASQQEPEFPGHSILEQYQAQISAALRPAFSADTAPNVTAAACHVCSTWMCCGVAQDLSDLRRVQQLLLSALNRITAAQQCTLPPLSGIGGLQQHRLYNESAATLENLSVLKAWAEVYVSAMKDSRVAEGRHLLLPLVKPELAGLAQFWLAALKDHALLTLPPEFGPQLPPEGGTFYTHDAADLSRPYYKLSWPPLLQAAALWLGHANNAGETIEPDNVYSNHFFLVFGIVLEALCDLKSTEPDSSTAACLYALQSLLHSPKARNTMTCQPPLTVEVCNVLHRVVLTKKAPIQHQAFEVLLALVQATHEQMNRLSDSVSAGEGGSEGELLPGTSLVFAALEVCLCQLVQVYPNMDPSATSSTKSVRRIIGIGGKIGEELVAAALDVMGLLPSVCSPHGALSLLPALLHLVTNILQEARTLESPAVQAALRCLNTYCSHPFSKLPETEGPYGKLLQSCAARLLDWGKAGQEEDRLDPLVLLSAVSGMLLNAPSGLLSCPALLYPSLNAFQQSLQSADARLRLHTLGLFGNLLQDANRQLTLHPENAKSILRPLTPYVHALAPKIVAHLCNPTSRLLNSQQQLLMTIESITCVEALTALADGENSLLVLQLLVPILINCLLDPMQMKTSNPLTKTLHAHALQTLTRIGTQYPQEFKSLLSVLPELRTKLESAARASQMGAINAKQGAMNTTTEIKAAPTIKLKTDFSNFN